jgi:L-ascorbate metabolism protein UlaG (beta-lactamase superfamily)
VKRWLKRIGLVLAALTVLLIGYGAWRFRHPALPADTRILASRIATPGSVTVRFMGTTTLAFSDGSNTIMIDALLTRPGMRAVMFGTVKSDPAVIGDVLQRASLDKVDLLFVSHSHYDHALDAAAVAARTGAVVVGSPSTQQIALGGGIPASRTRVVKGGELFEAGAFKITVIRSLHSPGDRVPGIIAAPLHQPAKASDYKEGGTFAFLIEHNGQRILVHPSANFVPGMYRGVHADVVFLATGGLSLQPTKFTQDYWRETVEATGATLVIPIHWDDFLQPLDQPLQPLRIFLDDIPQTMTRLDGLAARDGVKIRYMPVFAPVALSAAIKSGE